MKRRYTGAVRLLEKVISILANPEAWTRHFNARDAMGQSVDPHHPKAVCFCINGAMIKAQGKNHQNVIARQEVEQILSEVVGYSPVTFNDANNRRHKDVMKALYKAHDWAVSLANE